MSEVVTRLNLLRSQHAHDSAHAAGPGRHALERGDDPLSVRAARDAIRVCRGGLADSYGAHILPIPESMRMFAALGAAVLGFFAPDVFIKNLIKKRQHQMELGLPDALDLLVICAEAGLSLDASLVRVSRELELTWPELSEEFGITAAELTYLPGAQSGVRQPQRPHQMGSVRGVVNTLLQTAKFGTPLAQSLRILAAEFREDRITRAEEKAARLPAMLTVPMILFILPTLFIVLLGPAILGVVDTFSGKPKQQASQVTEHRAGAPGGGALEAARRRSVVERSPRGPEKTLQSEAPVGDPSVTREPGHFTVRAGDLLTVDIDARALREGSQHRVAIVRREPPKPPSDLAEYTRRSVSVPPDRMRVSVSGAIVPGAAEVRLYSRAAVGRRADRRGPRRRHGNERGEM